MYNSVWFTFCLAWASVPMLTLMDWSPYRSTLWRKHTIQNCKGKWQSQAHPPLHTKHPQKLVHYCKKEGLSLCNRFCREWCTCSFFLQFTTNPNNLCRLNWRQIKYFSQSHTSPFNVITKARITYVLLVVHSSFPGLMMPDRILICRIRSPIPRGSGSRSSGAKLRFSVCLRRSSTGRNCWFILEANQQESWA